MHELQRSIQYGEVHTDVLDLEVGCFEGHCNRQTESFDLSF